MIKRNIIIAVIAVLLAAGYFLISGHKKDQSIVIKEVTPFYGRIENSVSATGNVQPQNRLVIKPPISGRIEKILVEEGQNVKAGDILAIMSSTDRAALLDAARLQGKDSLKEWEDVYKPTSLLAPIDAQVIVKSVNPGQTVTSNDDVIVLSDRLIVQAQVDETDIGGVKSGQEAKISLDAYPKIKVKAKVDHISYESKTVNNVTIYQVDILPEHVPDEFRSGMSANVRIIQARKDNVLLLPAEAFKREKDKNYVFLRRTGKSPFKQEVEIGLADESNVEIVSGIDPQDTIVIEIHKKDPSKGGPKGGGSPFMPSSRGNR